MWEVAKALHIPLDKRIEELSDLPYTLSFVIRKRKQLDSLNELPKEKRPPDKLIWEGTSEELEEWIERVYQGKEEKEASLLFMENEIE